MRTCGDFGIVKGRILRDIESTIDGDFFFRKGDIVEMGFHTDGGELSEDPTEHIWAQNFCSNPANSLDFLNADDVRKIEG